MPFFACVSRCATLPRVLDRVRIQGFKSLHDVELRLSPLVVLFGPNASGKSNFLESLILLSRLVTERTISDALAPPLRGNPLEAFSLPQGGLRELLSREKVSLELEADVTPPELREQSRGVPLRYRVAIEAAPASGEMRTRDEYLTRLGADGSPQKSFNPRIERLENRLVVRRLNEAGQPRHEDVGLNHTLASNLQFSGKKYPDFDRLRTEVGAWRTYYLDPTHSMRLPQSPREVEDIGPSGEFIAPFLYRLKGSEKHRRHFTAVSRALRAAIPSVQGLDVDLDKERGTLDIKLQQHRTEYSSRIVSEGTLRVLALCAIAANPWPARLITFEEPENGVHPRRLEVIANLLWGLARAKDRQVVVTTHSPTLVAAILERQRREPHVGALMRCTQEGRDTRISEFTDPLPLFQDEEIRAALTGGEDGDLFDEQMVVALMRRGWMDG